MHLIDLTHALSESTLVHPLKTPFSRKICANYEQGAAYEDINLSSGIGTHMDAPRHFYPHGSSIDQIPLDQCCGYASVLHLAHKVNDHPDYEITIEDIQAWEAEHGPIPPNTLLLAHTGWDKYWGKKKFCTHFPGFSAAAASYLLNRKLKGVGIDTTSIDPASQPQAPAHQIFLKEGLILLENLANLEKLPPKGSFVCLLPMKIENTPESPVRAIAFLGTLEISI